MDLPTERNVAFTLVEVEPTFFWTGPDLLDLRVPGMLMGRASVADLGDDHLVLVDLSDGDVISSQAAAIREVDRLADVRGSTTWWGAISKQSRDLEVEPPGDIGFVLARFDSREAGLRESQVAAAERELQSLEGAVLVARTIGSSDLLVLYDVDGSDLQGTLSNAAAIRHALEGHELVVEVEGIGMPLGPG